MSFLNFDEWLIEQPINAITEETIFLIESVDDLEILEEYLYENYDIILESEDFLCSLNEADAPNEAPKPTLGQKVKGHFKKHWKKYAAGAALAGAGAYLGHKHLQGKKAEAASKAAVDQKVADFKEHGGRWEKRANAHDKVVNWAMQKMSTEKDPAKRSKYVSILRRNSDGAQSSILNALGDVKHNADTHKALNRSLRNA